MDTWLAAGNFNDATLKGTTYLKVGVACSCDATSQVWCAFIFGDYLIGNEITDKIP